MHPMLNTAIQAARKAGNLIMRYYARLDILKATEKQQNDFVTEADTMAEYEIISLLKKAYPEHAFLAEESGLSEEKEYLWIIDPLDGTTNFMHGFPHFAVSIALQYKGILQQAVIYDPVRQELFSASRGKGAHLNNQRLRVSQRKNLTGALIGTGFPFKSAEYIQPYLATFQNLFLTTAGIRRAGAACLDLAYVAAGRLDGFWEFGLQPWDLAAGILLIKEAGGLVSDIDGSENHMKTGNIVAGNPKIFKHIVQTLAPCTAI